MKKLKKYWRELILFAFFILLMLMLIPQCNAQAISIGLDPKMALQGPYENSKPEIDFQIRFIDVYEFGEVGLFTEYFPTINYFNWGLFGNKRLYEYRNLELLAGIEASVVVRGRGKANAGYLSYGFNGDIRHYFGKFGIGIQGNYKRRPELEKFVYSTFVNFYYRFKK